MLLRPLRRWVTALLGVLVLAAPSCSRRTTLDSTPASADLGPVAAPAGQLVDVRIADPAATWPKVRRLLPQSLNLPETFAAVVPLLLGAASASSFVAEGVPLSATITKVADAVPEAAMAIPLRDPKALLAEVTRPGASTFTAVRDRSSGILQLEAKGAASTRHGNLRLGVLGDKLLVATSPHALQMVGPYVARPLATTPPKGDVFLEFPRGAFTGALLDELKAGAKRLAEGQPAPLAAGIDWALNVVADANHAQVSMTFEEENAHAEMTLEPTAGSQAERFLGAIVVGDTAPLLALPAETAFAMLWREAATARVSDAAKQAVAISDLIGTSFTQEDRTELGAALASEAAARGEFQTFGVMLGASGPTAVIAAPVHDEDQMKRSLKQLLGVASRPSVGAKLLAMGLRMESGKAPGENRSVPRNVTRIRFSRVGAAKRSRDGSGEIEAVDSPLGLDLFYLVEKGRLLAAAGFDPKGALLALQENAGAAPSTEARPMFRGLEALGADVAFALVADWDRVVRLVGMGSVAGPRGAGTPPILIALGRTQVTRGLWVRVEAPLAVMAHLIQAASGGEGSNPASFLRGAP